MRRSHSIIVVWGQTKVLVAFILMSALLGCGQFKSNGSIYLGKWHENKNDFNGQPYTCLMDISRNGESFIVKEAIAGAPLGSCFYSGIYTLTPEGNLKGGPMGVVSLSFDKNKNQIIISGGESLSYYDKN